MYKSKKEGEVKIKDREFAFACFAWRDRLSAQRERWNIYECSGV